MIPSTERQRHAASAGFHEASRDEEMLHQFRAAIVAIARVALAVTLHELWILVLEVKRRHELAGSQNAERLLGISVEAGHLSAGIDIAPESVHGGQQRATIGEAIKRDAVEDHVVLARALVDLKRRVGRTEEASHAVVRPRHMPHLRRKSNERWNRRITRALELRKQRTHRRPAAQRLITIHVARVALEGFVTIFHADHRADDRAFIHHLGEARQMFANLDARNVRRDGSELPAHFAGRVGL